MFEEYMKSLNEQYMKALQHLEEYVEFIVFNTEYTSEDIMVVHADLGNHRMVQMIVCPKSCIINGEGILPCDYFIGLEEIQDEEGFFKGWNIIYEIPDKLKTYKY